MNEIKKKKQKNPYQKANRNKTNIYIRPQADIETKNSKIAPKAWSYILKKWTFFKQKELTCKKKALWTKKNKTKRIQTIRNLDQLKLNILHLIWISESENKIYKI